MATYDLDRVELNHLLSPNVDPSVRAAVLDNLFNNDDHRTEGHDDDDDGRGRDHDNDRDHGGNDHFHFSHVKRVEVQISNGTDPLDPHANVLDLTSAHATVTTDANLEAIVQNVSGNSDLTVFGHADVMIATGTGDNKITLNDSGDDVVLTGRGNDTVYGGAGHDSIYGGGGSDSLVAGSGGHQLLVAGDGSDTLYGGDGAYDTLIGGAGKDQIHAGNGQHQLVDGGAGNDTIWAGSGGDSLYGGDGNDVFHIATHQGNDTVDGGSGHNVIDFDNRASTDVASLHTHAGVTVIHFTDGQTVTASHVQDLVFTDTDHKLP
jgi:Ca2+-binding RTX toxin-like protein